MKNIKITYQLVIESTKYNGLLDEMTITYDFSNDQERSDVINNLNDSSLDVYDKVRLMQKLLHFNKELYEVHKALADSSEIYNRDVNKNATGKSENYSVISILVCAVEVDDTTLVDFRNEEDYYDYMMEIDKGCLGAWVKNKFVDSDKWDKILAKWFV